MAGDENYWAVNSTREVIHNGGQSDLVYTNSLVPIRICLDCETYGLLNHCK